MYCHTRERIQQFLGIVYWFSAEKRIPMIFTFYNVKSYECIHVSEFVMENVTTNALDTLVLAHDFCGIFAVDIYYYIT